MKKIIICFVMLLAIAAAACGKQDTPQTTEQSAQIGMPNPFKECKTVDEAVKIGGFKIEVPDKIDEFAQTDIQAIEDKLIQVTYQKDDQRILLRKAIKNKEEISGDYNTYSDNSEVSVDGNHVTLKANGEEVHVAIWSDDSYSYAIDVDGTGISKDTMIQIVSQLK